MKKKQYFCTGFRKLLSKTLSKTRCMERTPEAYVSDIEQMTGMSYRTAQRIMKRVRDRFGIAGRKHPTIEQVREYFRINS